MPNPKKRKRVPRKRKYVRKSRFRKGYNRTGGYYGRFSGPKAELKFHDVDLDDATINTAGDITASINLIAQGTTESQRIGRKCVIRSIGWHFMISLLIEQDQADIGGGDVLRIIMYLDKQCNGATAVVSTVAGILATPLYDSFNNLSNKSRFRTLMDRTYDLNRQVAGTDGANTVGSPALFMHDTFYKKCNIPLEFSSTTGAITEIRSNNIGVLLISRSNLAAIEGRIRLRFSDAG